MSQEAPNPIADGRRLLMLVAEMHRRGYERLRVIVGMAPSGMYWRCSLYAAGAANYSGGLPPYSTSSGLKIFGWADADADDPSALAAKFLEHFPELAARAHGSDPAYVAWFAAMLRQTDPDLLPITFADWELPPDLVSTIGSNRRRVLPLPPPYVER